MEEVTSMNYSWVMQTWCQSNIGQYRSWVLSLQPMQPWHLAHRASSGFGNMVVGEQWQLILLPSPAARKHGRLDSGSAPFPCAVRLGQATSPSIVGQGPPTPPCSWIRGGPWSLPPPRLGQCWATLLSPHTAGLRLSHTPSPTLQGWGKFPSPLWIEVSPGCPSLQLDGTLPRILGHG